MQTSIYQCVRFTSAFLCCEDAGHCIRADSANGSVPRHSRPQYSNRGPGPDGAVSDMHHGLIVGDNGISRSARFTSSTAVRPHQEHGGRKSRERNGRHERWQTAHAYVLVHDHIYEVVAWRRRGRVRRPSSGKMADGRGGSALRSVTRHDHEGGSRKDGGRRTDGSERTEATGPILPVRLRRQSDREDGRPSGMGAWEP